MGLAKRMAKGGGGFLNNVDGLILDYKFTDEPDFKGDGSGFEQKGEFTRLWCALTVRQDGSEAPEVTHLPVGRADDFVISEDGHVLERATSGALPWPSEAFAQFYNSMVENAGDSGFEDIDPSPDDPLDFTHIIGVRVRFVQVKDEDAMARLLKWAKKNPGKPGAKKVDDQGRKKGKDGKFYDIRTLQVAEVYSIGNDVEESAAPKKGAKGGKPASSAPVRGKVAAKKQVEEDNDDDAAALAEFAKETLQTILSKAKGNSVKKTDLNGLVTRTLVKDARREDVRKYLFDDDNLATLVEEGVITFNKKTQTITAVED